MINVPDEVEDAKAKERERVSAVLRVGAWRIGVVLLHERVVACGESEKGESSVPQETDKTLYIYYTYSCEEQVLP